MASPAFADPAAPQPSQALTETIPAVFPANDLADVDFEIAWDSLPLAGLTAEVAKGSVQWVRLDERVSLPRGLLQVHVAGAHGGALSARGVATPLEPEGGGLGAVVPVVLLTGSEDGFEVRLDRSGAMEEGRFHLVLRHRAIQPRVAADVGCSPWVTSVGGDGNGDWAYLGCRLMRGQRGDDSTPVLELTVVWDAEGPLEMGGVPVEPLSPSLWLFRFTSNDGRVVLRRGGRTLDLSLSIPEVAHNLTLRGGLGPYQYVFTYSGSGPGVSVNRVSPLATVYASYFFSETARLVAFDATVVDPHPFSDLGLYVNYESVRILDRRISLNVMLGGHALAFGSPGDTLFRVGIPQGAEVVIRDAGFRDVSLSLGGFIYPQIGSSAYYNAWIRYGSSQFFGELNYISWQENGQFAGDNVVASCMGATFGFPLFSAL